MIRRRNHRLQNCPIKIEALPGESEVSVSDDDEEVFKDSAYWPDEAQNTNSDVSTADKISANTVILKKIKSKSNNFIIVSIF